MEALKLTESVVTRWEFMNKRFNFSAVILCFMVSRSMGGDVVSSNDLKDWQVSAVEFAKIMSRLRWSPVADGIPIRGKGEFKADTVFTGVPYSNGGWDGRMIGFDINLRTFLAAVENPQSVLYTENLRGQRRNSAAFYGMVCSSFTSYALQLAIPVGSSYHGASYREGVEPADPQSAQGASVGDVLWFSGHVELVTQVKTAPDGTVTHVRVEDSWPPTTRTKDYTAAQLNDYLKQRNARLYRITDHAAWRGENRAERFLFPNYAKDAEVATINRVLLLDFGDWVVYRKDHPVVFNVMDRDQLGVETLVIEREGVVVEEIAVNAPQTVERRFSRTGDYSAYCLMQDGSRSQACEFSVCQFDSSVVTDPVVAGESWKVKLDADHMNAIMVSVSQEGDPDYSAPVAPYRLWVNDQHRRQGYVTIPADVLNRSGRMSLFVIGENRYGRLRNRHVIEVVKAE